MNSDPFERLQHTASPHPLNESVQSVSKKGSKISPKVFLIGCGSLFLIFLGLIYGSLYFAASSGEFLESIGMQIEDVKNILKIFAALFFGIIFIIGAYLLFFSIYKIATVKEKRAIYGFGILSAFIVITFTIAGGVFAFTKINNLAGKQIITSNSYILPFLEIKNNKYIYINEPGFSVIGPATLRFQLNREMYNKFIVPELGNNSMTSLELDCGNGQILSANQAISIGKTNSFFPNACFYFKKGDYKATFKVNYINANNGEKGNLDFEVPTIRIVSEIVINPLEGEARINDEKTEYILGSAPLVAQFKANKVFTDLQLGENKILRDMDGNGNIDITDNSIFKYPFNEAKLNYIYYKLPNYIGYEDTWFQIPVRIEESDVAGCKLDLSAQENKKITVTPKFDEIVEAKSYMYSIKNINSGDFVEIESDTPELTYTIPKGGQYEVAMKFFTSEGKKGSCGILPIDIGFDNNMVVFDLDRKQNSLSKWQKAEENTDVSYSGKNTIFIQDIPMSLRITINSIQPDPTADLKVFFDDRQIFSEIQNTYIISLAQLGEKSLKFEVTTKEGKVTNQEYTLKVDRPSIKATIKVDKTVGEDPLEIDLDASVSSLYDETDEIVYFSWDFGDGDEDKNTSQGKVKHIYTFDKDNKQGRYFPKVTITTKKGQTDTFIFSEGISVKKQQKEAFVRIDSHPTQQVKLGDIVKMRLQTDGNIKSISRDFGQGKKFSCEGRSCLEITTTYDEIGEFDIRAEIEYSDGAPVISSPIKIRVFE